MLIKWIKCQVDDKNKWSFSEAQERWSKIKESDGFLGQIGGWDKNKAFEAGIISFWKDSCSYKKFMDHQHDEIYEKSNQNNTYKNISVKMYEKMFDISSTDITRFLSDVTLLRIADCCVDIKKQLHFEQMQKEVWNKGMTDSTGMLAGVFCRNQKQKGMYLVASLWDTNRSHQWYVDNKLPSLIQHSDVKDTAISMTGNVIEINPKWVVF